MDTASLVLVVLRLSEVKNKHTVSQPPVLNVSVKPCWLTHQSTRYEIRYEKNIVCSACKCTVSMNTDCLQAVEGEARAATATLTPLANFCSKQYVLAKRWSSKDCSCKDLLPT